MIQGGVNPELRIEWFERLFERVRREYPQVDIHSLSVSEIDRARARRRDSDA